MTKIDRTIPNKELFLPSPQAVAGSTLFSALAVISVISAAVAHIGGIYLGAVGAGSLAIGTYAVDRIRVKLMYKKLLKEKREEESFLETACGLGDLFAIRYFVEQGEEINHENNQLWQTPLALAVESGNLKAVRYLIEKGADVNLPTPYTGATPLYAAADRGDLEMVDYLLKQGAQVNACNHVDNTPLHRAAYQDHPKIVELLLKAGADPTLKNNDGFAPGEYKHAHNVRKFLAAKRIYPFDIKTQMASGNPLYFLISE